jgi:hypothetical protein
MNSTSISPELLTEEWKSSLNSTVIKVILLTVVFFITLLITFSMTNFQEVFKNWSRYRCNPAFMPFASMAGYNPIDNFQFCLNSIVGVKAAEIFAPIFNLFYTFVSILSNVIDAILGLRQLFENFFWGVNNFFKDVRDRIQSLLFQIRLSFLKLKNLMGRVYGTMFSVVFMGMSAITAGMNLSENSLVNFVLEFCFAPDTHVRMEDGTSKQIADIRVGEKLANNRTVKSVLVFDGSKTPMVRIGNDHISSQHFVQMPDGTWDFAEHHPNAVPAESSNTLYCLNVEGNQFVLASGLIVRDYDETEDSTVVAETQHIADAALNGSNGLTKTVENYSLGIDPACEVFCTNNAWKNIQSVSVGDHLVGNHAVLGTVQEQCSQICELPNGLLVSAAQYIHDPVSGTWKRAETLYPSISISKPLILHHIITKYAAPLCVRKNSIETWMRDYREAAIPEMETPYMAAVKNE